jgi:hypothetical protein
MSDNRFYKTARWQRLRQFQLREHPLCKFCLERGRVTSANVVDHVVPHPAIGLYFALENFKVYARSAMMRPSVR